MTSAPGELQSDVEATRVAMNSLLISLRAASFIGDEPVPPTSDRTSPAQPTRCAHDHAVPVRSVVDDELLAALCPDCGEQLPAEWVTCDHSSAHESSVDITSLGEPPGRRSCNGCGVTYWPPPHRPSTDTHDGEARS